MKNTSNFNRYSPVFLTAGLLLVILFPAIILYIIPFSASTNASFSLREIAVVFANGLGIACIYMALRQLVDLQQQQQEIFRQQLSGQHLVVDTCNQAEKNFQEIKIEWEKLMYKRYPAEDYASYETVIQQGYTGGTALEKYSDDIREYGEDFYSQTAEVEYHLRYVLLLMKSFITDLQECSLPATQKKVMFKNFFLFYSAKAEFHFGHLHTETACLASFVQLHDEIEEVQHMIEQMADIYNISSPND